MCDVCRRSPCDSRCPNAPDSPKFGVCSVCDADILDGDDYYNIDGEYWCADCIADARTTAEV